MQKEVYLVKSNQGESGTIETLAAFEKLHFISDNEVENLKKIFSNQEKIAIISESAIANILSAMSENDPKRKAIECFKDKFLFRELVKNAGFDVQKVAFQDLEKLKIKNKSVIKPLKGCFGTAVKIVDENSDLLQIKAEIQQELDKNSSVFSDDVLTPDDFILEDFIEGEEYAIDMFYNREGKPCVVNIYHHPIPKNEQYLHMIYYTSKSTFETIFPLAKSFFTQLNEKIGVTDFPMHCEFKLTEGKLVPIEINSMRFGGMGLGNLVYHSFGIDPYQCFSEDIEPNWAEIMEKTDENARYIYLIAYNSFSKDKNTHRPNVEKLRSKLTEIKLEKLFDYQKQLAFGVFCLGENAENLEKLLQIDFDDYFEPID